MCNWLILVGGTALIVGIPCLFGWIVTWKPDAPNSMSVSLDSAVKNAAYQSAWLDRQHARDREEAEEWARVVSMRYLTAYNAAAFAFDNAHPDYLAAYGEAAA